MVGWFVRELPGQPPANVTITTNAPDVVPHYQAADVFLFPSLVDGFGLVVPQAMACGLPVICTENTGAKDIVTAGHDGWVVNTRDVDAMVAHLETLDRDRDLLEQMSTNARATAETYTWDRFYEGMETVFGFDREPVSA
jgi:glycosyltransferase involved in cell wall biosynthesis